MSVVKDYAKPIPRSKLKPLVEALRAQLKKQLGVDVEVAGSASYDGQHDVGDVDFIVDLAQLTARFDGREDLALKCLEGLAALNGKRAAAELHLMPEDTYSKHRGLRVVTFAHPLDGEPVKVDLIAVNNLGWGKHFYAGGPAADMRNMGWQEKARNMKAPNGQRYSLNLAQGLFTKDDQGNKTHVTSDPVEAKRLLGLEDAREPADRAPVEDTVSSFTT